MAAVTARVSNAVSRLWRFRFAEGVGAGGLASRGARWALVFAWTLGAARRIIGAQAAIPLPWFPVSYTMLLLAVLLLTRRENLPLRGARAILVPTLALGALTVVLAAQPERQPIWLLYFTVYMMAFLFIRGNPVLGCIGTAACFAVVIVWTVASGAPTALLSQLLIASLVACTVAALWRVTLAGIATRERAHRSEAAEHARQIAAEQAAAEHLRAELELVRDRAESALTRLRDGEPLDGAFHAELAVIEGGIRDRIRSPRLQHPELNREIDAARARGASVTVLAEDAPGSPRIGERAALELAAAVRDLDDADSLVIAWTEADRVSVVSVRGERRERRVVEIEPGKAAPPLR